MKNKIEKLQALFYPLPTIEFMFCKSSGVTSIYDNCLIEKPYNHVYVYLAWLCFGYRFKVKIK